MIKILFIPVAYLMFQIIYKHRDYKQIRNLVIIGLIIAAYILLKKNEDKVVEKMLSLPNDIKGTITLVEKDIEQIQKVTDYLKNNAKLIGKINFTKGQKFAILTRIGERASKFQYSNNFLIYEMLDEKKGYIIYDKDDEKLLIPVKLGTKSAKLIIYDFDKAKGDIQLELDNIRLDLELNYNMGRKSGNLKFKLKSKNILKIITKIKDRKLLSVMFAYKNVNINPKEYFITNAFFLGKEQPNNKVKRAQHVGFVVASEMNKDLKDPRIIADNKRIPVKQIEIIDKNKSVTDKGNYIKNHVLKNSKLIGRIRFTKDLEFIDFKTGTNIPVIRSYNNRNSDIDRRSYKNVDSRDRRDIGGLGRSYKNSRSRDIREVALECGINPTDVDNYSNDKNISQDNSLNIKGVGKTLENITQQMNLTSYGPKVQKCMQKAITQIANNNEKDKKNYYGIYKVNDKEDKYYIYNNFKNEIVIPIHQFTFQEYKLGRLELEVKDKNTNNIYLAKLNLDNKSNSLSNLLDKNDKITMNNFELKINKTENNKIKIQLINQEIPFIAVIEMIMNRSSSSSRVKNRSISVNSVSKLTTRDVVNNYLFDENLFLTHVSENKNSEFNFIPDPSVVPEPASAPQNNKVKKYLETHAEIVIPKAVQISNLINTNKLIGSVADGKDTISSETGESWYLYKMNDKNGGFIFIDKDHQRLWMPYYNNGFKTSQFSSKENIDKIHSRWIINFYSDGITLHTNKENKVKSSGWNGRDYTGPKGLIVTENQVLYESESGLLWRPKNNIKPNLDELWIIKKGDSKINLVKKSFLESVVTSNDNSKQKVTVSVTNI